MTDLEKATNELANALDLIKGNKLFDKKLIIETALKKYADSEVKKLNIPAVINQVCPECKKPISPSNLDCGLCQERDYVY